MHWHGGAAYPRGGQNPCGPPPQERAGGQTQKNGKTKGVLPPPWIWKIQGAVARAVFEKHGLFQSGIKRNGVKRVAKDGTRRGGARPGAGRKPKALADKIKDGQKASVMMVPAELESVDMPPIRDFLTEEQRDGTKLCSQEIYEETYRWLQERKCAALVSRQLVEQYAMSVGRWIHCEQTISKLGYIAKHPTTSAAIASPYVKMAQDYMKQVNTVWNEIYQVVKENCSGEWSGTPQDDAMQLLLRARAPKNGGGN